MGLLTGSAARGVVLDTRTRSAVTCGEVSHATAAVSGVPGGGNFASLPLWADHRLIVVGLPQKR
jgi:hypothetical protein